MDSYLNSFFLNRKKIGLLYRNTKTENKADFSILWKEPIGCTHVRMSIRWHHSGSVSEVALVVTLETRKFILGSLNKAFFVAVAHPDSPHHRGILEELNCFLIRGGECSLKNLVITWAHFPQWLQEHMTPHTIHLGRKYREYNNTQIHILEGNLETKWYYTFRK